MRPGGLVEVSISATSIRPFTLANPGGRLSLRSFSQAKVPPAARSKEGDQPGFSIACHGLDRFIDRRRQPIG